MTRERDNTVEEQTKRQKYLEDLSNQFKIHESEHRNGRITQWTLLLQALNEFDEYETVRTYHSYDHSAIDLVRRTWNNQFSIVEEPLPSDIKKVTITSSQHMNGITRFWVRYEYESGIHNRVFFDTNKEAWDYARTLVSDKEIEDKS